MAYKKINKDFILSDSSLNVYGFKLLTSGYKMDEFLKNPIGYYGHDKTDGVLLKWDDVRLDGDRVLGKPVINMEHPRAERTVSEIEEGFLNAASVGKIHVISYVLEDNPEDACNPILVATEWYNKECSLVDNPGNRHAMKAQLCDAEGNEINLADLIETHVQEPIAINVLKSKKQKPMKEVTLKITPALIGLLRLGDEQVTADAVNKGIQDLHDENVQLAADKSKLAADLAEERASVTAKEIKAILDKGLSDGKINVKLRSKLEKQFAGKVAELRDLIDAMDAYVPVNTRIAALPSKLKNLADKTYNELDKMGKLELVKQEAPDLYEEKFEQHFGHKPTR